MNDDKENHPERPKDPDDVWDPTGYYRDKLRRQEEELAGCLWITVLAFCAGLIGALYQCTLETTDLEPETPAMSQGVLGS